MYHIGEDKGMISLLFTYSLSSFHLLIQWKRGGIEEGRRAFSPFIWWSRTVFSILSVRVPILLSSHSFLLFYFLIRRMEGMNKRSRSMGYEEEQRSEQRNSSVCWLTLSLSLFSIVPPLLYYPSSSSPFIKIHFHFLLTSFSCFYVWLFPHSEVVRREEKRILTRHF